MLAHVGNTIHALYIYIYLIYFILDDMDVLSRAFPDSFFHYHVRRINQTKKKNFFFAKTQNKNKNGPFTAISGNYIMEITP